MNTKRTFTPFEQWLIDTQGWDPEEDGWNDTLDTAEDAWNYAIAHYAEIIGEKT